MSSDHLAFVDAASFRGTTDREGVVTELECAFGVLGASSTNPRFTVTDLAWHKSLPERLSSPGCAAKADRLRSQGKKPEEHICRVQDSIYKLGKGSGLSILLGAEDAGACACLVAVVAVKQRALRLCAYAARERSTHVMLHF